ncbi:MAG: hypothetical protein V3T67_05520 [Nitrosopumilaceae archaeon]
MNLYDTKVIRCARCEKCMGEIDYDAEVIRPLCGQCANPLPEGDDILYTVSNIINQHKQKQLEITP